MVTSAPSILEQLTAVLQRDLIEHCASPYRHMSMATPEGQKFAIAQLRRRWTISPVSMPDGQIVTVTDIRRGLGSTDTFVELVVEIGDRPSYTVMVEFVDEIPREMIAQPPKKTRKRGHPAESEGDEDGDA